MSKRSKDHTRQHDQMNPIALWFCSRQILCHLLCFFSFVFCKSKATIFGMLVAKDGMLVAKDGCHLNLYYTLNHIVLHCLDKAGCQRIHSCRFISLYIYLQHLFSLYSILTLLCPTKMHILKKQALKYRIIRYVKVLDCGNRVVMYDIFWLCFAAVSAMTSAGRA